MEQSLTNINTFQSVGTAGKIEILRKGIHMLFASVPFFFGISKVLTLSVLAAFVIFYLLFELKRINGKQSIIYKKLIKATARGSEKKGIIWGPVTLVIGISLSLLIFPASITTAAVFAVTLGDGVASLVGTLWGRTRPDFLWGKSVEGSMACFFAAFFSSLSVLDNAGLAIVLAFFAAGIEVLPLGKMDNILVPLVSGAAVSAAVFII